MITFRIDCIPPKVTSQTKRLVTIAGKPRFFPKKSHQQAESDLLTLFAEHRPEKPLEGPLSLFVCFTFPWRKSEPKKNRVAGTLPMSTRPDADNLVKLAQDVLTRLGFYLDDGQVAQLRVGKQWGDRPGITVELHQIPTGIEPS